MTGVVQASQLMVHNWSVESHCDGFTVPQLIDVGASEITIEEGEDAGDLVVDFGLFALEGTIATNGTISVNGEGPTGLTQICSEQAFCKVRNYTGTIITATRLLLLTENCALTLSLIE